MIYFNYKIKELASKSIIIKFISGIAAISVGIIFYPLKKTRLISLKLICWSGRVLNIDLIERLSHCLIKHLYLKSTQSCITILLETCLCREFAKKALGIYSLGNDNKINLFRDVIILKEKSTEERGVILIKYTPAFDAFYHYFDVDKLYKDYFLVLEPSWAGACDISFLIYWRNTIIKNVIVQAIEPSDYRFIESVGGNFAPIDIGSSDWVNMDIFKLEHSDNKLYDLVMVSNWALHKKHCELFKALSKTKMKLSVLLIGFPWDGRTKHHIWDEIRQHNLSHINFVIKENLPAREVSALLNNSKVYLLLSKKEGGNKSIIEAFASNVPAILYDKFIGGVQTYINEKTGILSSYSDLKDNIEYMVLNYQKYSPREWIINHSGSSFSTKKLNTILKSISISNHETWEIDIVEKVNSPNLEYKHNINTPFEYDKLFSMYKH